MPNDNQDWLLLRRNISNFKGTIALTWGAITADNASKVSTQEIDGKTLFEFLIEKECFADANTIASYISLFEDRNINVLTEKHHQKYVELVKILSTNKSIMAYEEFDKLVKNTESESTSEGFNEMYREVISSRFSKVSISQNELLEDFDDIILDTEHDFPNQPRAEPIIELIGEFKFLSHPNFDDFYTFLVKTNNKNKFTEAYKVYLDMIPLIYRLINEYYMEYIKHQINMINDFSTGSFILMDNYDNLKKCLNQLPKTYVDYRYQDRYGNNLLMNLAMLPHLNNIADTEIYTNVMKSENFMPLGIQNIKGNTIFHIIAYYENEIFLQVMLDWFKGNKIKLKDLLEIENNSGLTVFDIMLENKSFKMIASVIDLVPLKFYKRLTKEFIDNFDSVINLPNNQPLQQLYLGSIDYFFEQLHSMKKGILYNISKYNEYVSKIKKLLIKCSNEIDLKQTFCLEWLIISIKIDELELFRKLMDKYFYNDQNPHTIKYLNQSIEKEGFEHETLIMCAIRSQNISFVKVLLLYPINLQTMDTTGKNPIIVALETKNLFMIKLLREHILGKKEYLGMIPIMDVFINLVEKHEVYNSLSVITTLRKIFGMIEYTINYLLHEK